MASKRPLPGEATLLELLHIAEAEADLAPDSEAPNAVDPVVGEAVNRLDGNLPAPGEILLGQNQPGGLWYVLDDRGRVSVVH